MESLRAELWLQSVSARQAADEQLDLLRKISGHLTLLVVKVGGGVDLLEKISRHLDPADWDHAGADDIEKQLVWEEISQNLNNISEDLKEVKRSVCDLAESSGLSSVEMARSVRDLSEGWSSVEMAVNRSHEKVEEALKAMVYCEAVLVLLLLILVLKALGWAT